ncbi:MAG: hypothetical protein LH481_14215 [Burkholderiales bacterium]|nr:hypothetical protein [Burkholderiales bacterium]
MSTTFPLSRLLISAAMLAAATAARAEAPPLAATVVLITPTMIREASQVAPQPRNVANGSRDVYRPNELFHEPPRNVDQIPNGCGQTKGSLCYDYRTGSTVYRPTRALLPNIPGMTPHNLAVRRDKIVAQYTFK